RQPARLRPRPAAPAATTNAPGVTSRAPLTNELSAPAGPALSRSTRSISTRRRVLMASVSDGASKIVNPLSPRNNRVRRTSSAVTTRTVFTCSLSLLDYECRSADDHQDRRGQALTGAVTGA